MIRYEEWLKRARSSLNLSMTAINGVISAHFYYEDLCYQTQQAVEKVLKGFLIYFGLEPEFTHNIEKLLEELEKFTDIPAHINEATELTAYAVFTRYPGYYDAVSKIQYEKAVRIAQECVAWVENTIKEIEGKGD